MNHSVDTRVKRAGEDAGATKTDRHPAANCGEQQRAQPRDARGTRYAALKAPALHLNLRRSLP